MRVQCDVCEKALAEVFCCADEAALCRSCDHRVHAANKLASKHQRLRLLHNLPDGPNPLPLCDICQEKGAFIFCLEDRALVCRDCDVCIHAANTLAAGHQRFLATGVQVALESEQQPSEDGSPPSKPETPLRQTPSCSTHETSPSNTNCSSSCLPPSTRKAGNNSLGTNICDNLVGNVSKDEAEWHDTLKLDLADLPSDYPLNDMDFSKTDLVELGEQDWLASICGFNEPVNGNSLGQVPQASIPVLSLAAPVLDSSSKGKQRREYLASRQDFDSVPVVPELGPLSSHVPPSKRQKSGFAV